MNLTVVGAGYIGLVTSLCFSEVGYNVFCIDVDQTKIKNLKNGISHIYESQIERLLHSNSSAGRIHFFDEFSAVESHSNYFFIAVGTPLNSQNESDLSQVFDSVDQIVQMSGSKKTIIIKSTVPPGTLQFLKEKYKNSDVEFVSNPEFLREGSAVADCLNPDRIIIGADSKAALNTLSEIYKPFTKNNQPIIMMNPASAELSKYAANIMLASKISLMNEFSRICEKTGANIESVEQGISSDLRIGSHFLKAGLGYGGSCFPKDLNSFINFGKNLNEDLLVSKAINQTNEMQIERFTKKILEHCKDKKLITVWGASFKPETNDTREAPALKIISTLLNENFTVHLYDPAANQNVANYFKTHVKFNSIQYFTNQYDALTNSSTLIICTEWDQFRKADLSKLQNVKIFDGRNIFSIEKIKENKISYYSVGRPL